MGLFRKRNNKPVAKTKASASDNAPKVSRRHFLRNAAIATAGAAGLATAQRKGREFVQNNPNSPTAQKIKPVVQAVDNAGARVKAGAQAFGKKTGETGRNVYNSQPVKLTRRIGNNVTSKPIRTAAGALAVGHVINKGGGRLRETHPKIVTAATTVGAIGGAAAPHAAIALAGGKIAWDALSAKQKQALLERAGRSAGNATKNATRTAKTAAQKSKKKKP
jgi:hypothetical protein